MIDNDQTELFLEEKKKTQKHDEILLKATAPLVFTIISFNREMSWH